MKKKLTLLVMLASVMLLGSSLTISYADDSSELTEMKREEAVLTEQPSDESLKKSPENSNKKAPEEPASKGEVDSNIPDASADLTLDKQNINPQIPGGITCQGQGKVCIVDQTGQALRVITRTATPLFEGPDQNSKIRSDAVAAFQPAFVFFRKDLDFSDPTSPKGWYQVGYIQSVPIGWMRAADVMEWRQAMLVAYRHPGTGAERRPPVLQFENLEAIKAIVPSPQRQELAQKLYDAIDKKQKPQGVLATEPLQFVDIDDQFYFTPILEWKLEPRIEDSYYFRLMNAVPGERATAIGEGTLLNEEQLSHGLTEDGRPISEMRIDVKFIVDMTGSMQPYIDEVTNSILNFISQVGNDAKLASAVHFGLVGYRDNQERLPELEWTAKNFTPEMVSAPEMLNTLQNGGQPLVANRSSDEWSEDVLAGVSLGLRSKWSKNDIASNTRKVLVLIGDASGHPANSSKSSTKTDFPELREMANQANISILSVHLQDDYAKSDWPIAAEQFKKLGTNPSTNVDKKLGYIAINTKKMGELSRCLEGLRYDLHSMSEKIATGDDESARKVAKGEKEFPKPEAAPGLDKKKSDADLAITDGLFRTALVEFMGSETPPGKDFISWIHDYDLLNQNIQRIEVRVLISRQDMDNIIRQVENIKSALVQAKQAHIDFFTSLQILSAKTLLGENIQVDKSLAEQEYLPRWAKALPYRSELLNKDAREIEEFSASDKIALESRLTSKLNALKAIFQDEDRWITFDKNADPLERVTALPLHLMP